MSAKRKHDYKNNIAAWMCKGAKQRAKNKGVPFSITVDDITIPDVCPILGIPLVIADGIHTDNSPSLDRIVPELGYVPENVVVISRRANTIKNCGTAEEHLLIASYITERKGTLTEPDIKPPTPEVGTPYKKPSPDYHRVSLLAMFPSKQILHKDQQLLQG